MSKWEKGQSFPDTENLLALAGLFGVSADELAGLRRTAEQAAAEPEGPEEREAAPPEQKRRFPWWAAALLAAVLLVFLVPATAFWLLVRMETGPVEHVPSEAAEAEEQPIQGARPGLEETGEFALIWAGDSGCEYLTVGGQDIAFPFGTSLEATAPETVEETDFGSVKLHTVSCGALTLAYTRNEPDPVQQESEQDVLLRLETITQGYETPRGIQVGSRETEVLSAYGDELLYHQKEEFYTLVPHDYYYTYTAMDMEGGNGNREIAFFIEKGEVTALRLRMLLDETFEGADNLYSFPVVDGQPDFSQRREPEQEKVDATRTVYIALCALEDQRTNLSAEEAYRYRRDLYGSLQFMSWREFGRLGEAGKEDETIFGLLNWLQEQDALSEDEIYGLLAGWCRTDLDGAYAESYGLAMGRAFLLYPEEYVRLLAGKDFTDQEREALVIQTAFGAEAPQETYEQALAAIDELVLRSGALTTQAEERWGQALYDRLHNGYYGT